MCSRESSADAASRRHGAGQAIQRIRDAHGLQPRRVATFKLSKDPAFVEKLTDVVGLYLNPPDKTVVLCVKPGAMPTPATSAENNVV